MKQIKKITKPKDLIINGSNGNETIAIATYDKKGTPSIRLYDINDGRGFLMGSESAKKISRWLISAANWVKQEGGS